MPCMQCTAAATAHLSGLRALLQGGSPVQISQRTCSSRHLAETAGKPRQLFAHSQNRTEKQMLTTPYE